MDLRINKHLEVFKEAAASETSIPLNVASYRNVMVEVSYDSSYAGTIKFYGSSNKTAPDYTSVVALDNSYSGIQAINKEDWVDIDWDTWITITSWAAGSKLFEINSNLLESLWIKMTRTAGTINISLNCTTNA